MNLKFEGICFTGWPLSFRVENSRISRRIKEIFLNFLRRICNLRAKFWEKSRSFQGDISFTCEFFGEDRTKSYLQDINCWKKTIFVTGTELILKAIHKNNSNKISSMNQDICIHFFLFCFIFLFLLIFLFPFFHFLFLRIDTYIITWNVDDI